MMRPVRLELVVGGLARLAGLALVANLAGCPRPSPTAGGDGGSDGASTSSPSSASGAGFDPLALGRAEDARRAKDVAPEVRTSHDVAARRRSARALARIADTASVEGLVAHLADDDAETITWAAYGLGYACKGHEDAHVKLLAARAASLPPVDAGARSSMRGAAELEPHVAIARAIGRCGGALAEQALVALVKVGGAWSGSALLGLGDLATRRKQLGADAMTALLEAVRPDRSAAELAALDVAFYALSRAEAGESFGRRVLDAARAALARPSDSRILAIKTLGRAKELAKDAAPELLRVAVDGKTFTPSERAEAARSLGTLDAPGQASAAEALGRLVPDKDALAIAALLGPDFHVLLTMVGSLGPEPPRKAEPALRALSGIVSPSEPKPALARRLAELR
jgi:hypothetical protein